MSLPALSIGAWLRHDIILEHLDAVEPSSIIEFGPGLGAMGARLAEMATYEAVEPDPTSRSAAQKVLGDRVKAVPDELTIDRADAICAFEVLEHVADDAGALSDWVTRLRSGGIVVVSVPAFGDQYGAHDRLAGHLRRYSPEELRSLFIECGLEPHDIRLTGFPVGFVLQWARNRLATRRSEGSTATERTAASGRLYQLETHGWLTATVSWPFRLLQRIPVRRGTGLVGVARKP